MTMTAMPNTRSTRRPVRIALNANPTLKASIEYDVPKDLMVEFPIAACRNVWPERSDHRK